MKRVVVCLIVTKKYHIFVQPLIDSIKKYFLLRHQIEIVLFTDDVEIEYKGDERVKITKDLIVSYGFPEATLYRYKIMTSRTYNCDYIYYLDVDYLIVNEIDEEIFGDGLVAVLHPGFFSGVNGYGSWCDDERSNAYTFPENRKKYYCGGTQGGSYEHYYRAMQRMARDIADDEKRGVKAEWNDEAHFNKLLSELKNFKVLRPSYCTPEPPHLRKLWKIDHIQPKILALDKNHTEIRS
jgi:Glycosyltransferase family 6